MQFIIIGTPLLAIIQCHTRNGRDVDDVQNFHGLMAGDIVFFVTTIPIILIYQCQYLTLSINFKHIVLLNRNKNSIKKIRPQLCCMTVFFSSLFYIIWSIRRCIMTRLKKNKKNKFSNKITIIVVVTKNYKHEYGYNIRSANQHYDPL